MLRYQARCKKIGRTTRFALIFSKVTNSQKTTHYLKYSTEARSAFFNVEAVCHIYFSMSQVMVRGL
ncbi:hypothetical protein HNQ64_002121 [Prosthecobacter dejongeii]|uniref:Uncharacterized protein n=1 Tax=Prosthecobacter dejongeii TaxID=48465 RepID=A0A7W7YKW6_9BACT|nr:hypothetical protein [Prosthecobacter dejongeii]